MDTTAKSAGAAPQRKALANRAKKAPRDNPNMIPLPPKNNRVPKEAGEITEQEVDPSWLCEPVPKEPFQFHDKNGAPTQHPDQWQ